MLKRILTIVAGVAAFAVAGAATAADPIKIGFSHSKTGIFAPAATSQLQSYELWREQVTARGGLDVAGTRRPVEFVVYDDQSNTGKAVQIYEKLITDDKVDLLLVMTVNPGFGGQSIIEECVPKIQQVYEWRKEMGLDFRIEVDGGVNLKTAAECARAGADTFVAGSALFGERSLTRAVKKMHKVVSQVNSGFNK